jgi:hypothetical protein
MILSAITTNGATYSVLNGRRRSPMARPMPSAPRADAYAIHRVVWALGDLEVVMP